MRPFYLILTTYADGKMGASDPQTTVDAAADEYGEAAKLDPSKRTVLRIDPEFGTASDKTGFIEMVIAARMAGRNAA